MSRDCCLTSAEIASDLTRRTMRQPLLLVALDGRSGAGKSTLARRLAADLGASIIAGDDFYRVMDESVRLQLTPEEGVARYFDWERLAAEVLRPLRAGRPTVYRRYVWGENRLGNEASVDSGGVVLVEGVYVARPELVDLFDLVVLVRTDDLVRRSRVESRGENPMRWRKRWERAEDWYFAHAFPYHRVWCVAAGHEESCAGEPGSLADEAQ